ncbi:MAG: GFA family protein [Flavobacteriaceae bacterium]
MADVHTGGCACGAVRYRASGPLRPVVYCHCESCRRQTGHYVAATAAALAGFAVEGADSLGEWRATGEATRRFCRRCGSILFWQRDGADTVSIMAGSLDLPTGLAATVHIFTAEKGDYYEIADGLPCRLGA